MNGFSLLPKDEKTFNIVKQYSEDIINHFDLLREDCKLQLKEMEIHKYNTGKDGINWSDCHAENNRAYLNSCKQLAILFYCSNFLIDWDSFCDFTDRLNEIHDPILDKIFLK